MFAELTTAVKSKSQNDSRTDEKSQHVVNKGNADCILGPISTVVQTLYPKAKTLDPKSQAQNLPQQIKKFMAKFPRDAVGTGTCRNPKLLNLKPYKRP